MNNDQENRPSKSSKTSLNERLRKEGWRQDILTDFLSKAHHNTKVNFIKNKDWFHFLIDIVNLYREVTLLDLVDNENDEIVGTFLSGAYSCFLGSVRLSSSGQLSDSVMLSRGCIENALYGYAIEKKTELLNVWINRNESEKHKNEMRNQFTFGKIIKLIECDNILVAEFVKEQYDETIDLGAHPNVMAKAFNINMDGETTSVKILNTNDIIMKRYFNLNGLSGLVGLSIFRLIFPEQYEKAGIPERLHSLYNLSNGLKRKLTLS